MKQTSAQGYFLRKGPDKALQFQGQQRKLFGRDRIGFTEFTIKLTIKINKINKYALEDISICQLPRV